MMEIRSEEPQDADAVRAVLESAFPTSLEGRLADALRAAGRLSVALVAVEDGAVVGWIAFSPVTAAGATGGLGLAPLAVQRTHQKRGIGAALVRSGLASCRLIGARYVVVLGDPAYYERFGFGPAGRWGLVDEYGGGDAFQSLELTPGGIPFGAGLVKYAPEFSICMESGAQ